ncbi:MAG: hypothetical protein IPP47_03930 [Bryobacterales bacterium]|nr:hypothetical protein [Bryobacterales bacterium]
MRKLKDILRFPFEPKFDRRQIAQLLDRCKHRAKVSEASRGCWAGRPIGRRLNACVTRMSSARLTVE